MAAKLTRVAKILQSGAFTRQQAEALLKIYGEPSGVYRPVLEAIENIAGLVGYDWQWSRSGDVVTVSGRIDIDPVAAASTQVYFSLPVPTKFPSGDAGLAALAGTCNSAFQPAAVLGVALTSKGRIAYIGNSTNAEAFFLIFSYQVLLP